MKFTGTIELREKCLEIGSQRASSLGAMMALLQSLQQDGIQSYRGRECYCGLNHIRPSSTADKPAPPNGYTLTHDSP